MTQAEALFATIVFVAAIIATLLITLACLALFGVAFFVLFGGGSKLDKESD